MLFSNSFQSAHCGLEDWRNFVCRIGEQDSWRLLASTKLAYLPKIIKTPEVMHTIHTEGLDDLHGK